VELSVACSQKSNTSFYFRKSFEITSFVAVIKTSILSQFQVVATTSLAILPPAFTRDSAYATEYALAWAVLPSDEEDKLEAFNTFRSDVIDKTLQLNVEFM
jgi:hypothetical protein